MVLGKPVLVNICRAELGAAATAAPFVRARRWRVACGAWRGVAHGVARPEPLNPLGPSGNELTVFLYYIWAISKKCGKPRQSSEKVTN